ncbi:MFS transporter [Kitasatospora aureofaciens]|uniref:MFS transporter n=1 Tax=Kitasatospora aureofaciens TaxID=1894 RepID=UPI001C440BCF|nr:MFS transporter [Kitasatospora aureofaciens]MBV6702063.1 MFS transporter [Kitasatospora aureofaciens]
MPTTESQDRKSPWLILGVLSMGFFMTLLDMTIVNIALPHVMSGVHASLDEGLWVFSAYILGYATLLIVAGRLGDLFGPRRVYLYGLAIFVGASCLCGIAPNAGVLIAARTVQGIGGAMLAPQILPIVTMVFPPSKWGAAFGFTGALSGLAVLTGPTLGGVIVSYLDWRWIFYLNLPIGLASAYLVLRHVDDYRPGKRQPLALVPTALLILGLTGLAFGLIEGERLDWGLAAWAAIAAGVLVLTWFAVDQRRHQRSGPLLPFDLLRLRNFASANIIASIMGFSMLGAFLPISLYLQIVLDMSPLRAGFTIAAMPLTSALVAGVGGKLSDRGSGKAVILTGLACFTAGLGSFILVTGTDTSTLQLLGPFVLTGLGMGLVFSPLFSVGLRQVPPPQAGVASGLVNTAQEVGGLLASAAIGAVLSLRLSSGLRHWVDQQAQALPVEARAGFKQAFAPLTDGALKIGSAGPPPAATGAGDPSQVAKVQEAFADAFTSAMHSGLVLPVALLAVGWVAAFLLIRDVPAPSFGAPKPPPARTTTSGATAATETA